jgi:hypothetical protein
VFALSQTQEQPIHYRGLNEAGKKAAAEACTGASFVETMCEYAAGL